MSGQLVCEGQAVCVCHHESVAARRIIFVNFSLSNLNLDAAVEEASLGQISNGSAEVHLVAGPSARRDDATRRLLPSPLRQSVSQVSASRRRLRRALYVPKAEGGKVHRPLHVLFGPGLGVFSTQWNSERNRRLVIYGKG